MRTKTITYLIYPLQELSADAQQKAYEEWMSNFYYDGSDNRNTLEKFIEIFNINMNDWNYDSCTYNYRFTSLYNGDEEELSGERLLKYLVNNYWHELYQPKTYWLRNCQKQRKSRIFQNNDCVLTGYYADYNILEPIYEFLKAPYAITLYDLIDKCLNHFFKFCRDDVEDQLSEDSFRESCSANDYEFLSDGEMFN